MLQDIRPVQRLSLQALRFRRGTLEQLTIRFVFEMAWNTLVGTVLMAVLSQMILLIVAVARALR